MSIEVIDHVIIGWNQFYSMKSNRIYYDDTTEDKGLGGGYVYIG